MIFLTKKEKKAVDELWRFDCCYNEEIKAILNLIEKQQKELNRLKEIEQQHKTDNGLLRQELDMQIEHNKELEATLKQTQDSWFEDTQKLEQEKEKNKKLYEQNRRCFK